MILLIRETAAAIAFISAVIFGIAGLIGLFRFPGPYARLQAGSLCGTTAVFSTFIGALILSPNAAVAARVTIITIFFLISSPTGSHIVARFVWNSGIEPWKPKLTVTQNRAVHSRDPLKSGKRVQKRVGKAHARVPQEGPSSQGQTLRGDDSDPDRKDSGL